MIVAIDFGITNTDVVVNDSGRNKFFTYTNHFLYDGYTTASLLNQEDNFKIISKTLLVIVSIIKKNIKHIFLGFLKK